MRRKTSLQISREIAPQDEQSKQAETATLFIKAIQTIANKPENLNNFESYLSYHFDTWLNNFADTPEKITAELIAFAEMNI